jgi:hypothetical protein
VKAEAPKDLRRLARDLGYDTEGLARLKKKHGHAKLVRILRREWLVKCSEQPRMLRQGNPGGDSITDDEARGYTDKPYLAVAKEPEAVDDAELERQAKRSHETYAQLRWREQQRRDAKQASNRAMDSLRRLHRAGHDATDIVAEMEALAARAEAVLQDQAAA